MIRNLFFTLTLLLTAAVATRAESETNYLAEIKKIDAKKIASTKKAYELFVFAIEKMRSEDFEAMFRLIDRLEEYSTTDPSEKNKFYLNAVRGYHFSNMQMYGDAVKYCLKAILHGRTFNDKDMRMMISVYNTLGISYSKLGQNAKAARYFSKALDYAEKHKIQSAIAIYSNNLGLEYNELKRHTEARAYMKRCAKIFNRLGMEYYLPTAHLNIGTTFQMENEYDSALFYYRLAYNAVKDSGEAHMKSLCLCNMSEIYLYKGKTDSSLILNKMAYAQGDTIGDRYQMINVLLLFSHIYEKLKDFKNAHHFLKEHNRIKDELFTQEEAQKTTDAELAQASLQKQSQIKILKKNNELKQSELARNRLFSWTIAIVSLIILILLFVTFIRFREKKSANLVLSKQKLEIETQQKEITDSINYAKRIQHALLPPVDTLKKRFASHFVIYLPKHIVGGDFYYAEAVDDKTTWITVIDCTGHGVPGGFMSVLAHSALTKSISDEKINSPARVLERMSALVTEKLSRQQTQTLRDGMDMTLCKAVQNGNTVTLYVAAANNPLWIVRKNGTIEEIAATRQHVGYSEVIKSFDEHSINLEKGDKIYLFTDGFADQFGGSEGKKFKYKKLKELIVSTSVKPMNEQAIMLEKEFQDWKGDNEQMDDVCLMGIEV